MAGLFPPFFSSRQPFEFYLVVLDGNIAGLLTNFYRMKVHAIIAIS